MAGDVKSLQALFDKIYNERVVKQSTKRKRSIDKQKLRRLLKQRRSQTNEKSDAEKLPPPNGARSQAGAKNIWTTKRYNTPNPQTSQSVLSGSCGGADPVFTSASGDDVESVLSRENDSADPIFHKSRIGGMESVLLIDSSTDFSTEVAMTKSKTLTKMTLGDTNHTRINGRFKHRKGQKSRYSAGCPILSKNTQLDWKCEGNDIDMHHLQHRSGKRGSHKTDSFQATKHQSHPSLFSKVHAASVRKSIVDEL